MITTIMNKENNRSAAGLRRSAIVERIRLREEWSALKGSDDVPPAAVIRKRQNRILKKKEDNVVVSNNDKCDEIGNKFRIKVGMENSRITRATVATNEALRGVVALVEVGAEHRALALRAALTALGATVVPAWSPLVTHLIWSEGGCRSTRAKARALACRLVSPLWVEACAASGRRLMETTFPAAPRPSDLPSPKTLRRLLIKAEMENIPLADLLSDSKEDENEMKPRLRISSETERDISTDKSTDTSADTSHDLTRDQTDIETRVNTAPRRALPISTISPRPTKSRRKLFTQKEADISKSGGNETDADETPVRRQRPQLTQHERRELAKAERMARRLAAAHAHRHAHPPADAHTYRVVLTGMSRSERLAAYNAIRTLNGRVQKQVNRKTTHVLLGSCCEDSPEASPEKNIKNKSTNKNHENNSNRVNSSNMTVMGEMAPNENNMASVVDNMASKTQKLRTVNALLGAARGCRVLYAKWATDCLAEKRWLHHYGYEVPHLRKISLKARVERTALGRMRSEYAYDVFNGMRVRVSPNAEQKDAVIQLLTLCGAVVQHGSNAQNGGVTQHGRQLQDGSVSQHGRLQNAWVTRKRNAQNGGPISADYDIIVGVEDGQVSSKWVFDSVAASRMRTARRYVNNTVLEASRILSQECSRW
ncbi:unnamed protein product [Parnassius apollo]|uniref:(apollo) hypothetical protein n=1 Tax=Parnassius apollo TaxID=110799 RepID=A0A8S3YBT5_PARAO|nr:unnamed protein product [Parnassius apollo]